MGKIKRFFLIFSQTYFYYDNSSKLANISDSSIIFGKPVKLNKM